MTDEAHEDYLASGLISVVAVVTLLVIAYFVAHTTFDSACVWYAIGGSNDPWFAVLGAGIGFVGSFGLTLLAIAYALFLKWMWFRERDSEKAE